MAASGLRSSWLASATNCLTFDSDCSRAFSASSTLSSIRLNERPTRPTSLRGSRSRSSSRSGRVTRPVSRSISETLLAVFMRRLSGARVCRTTAVATTPEATMASATMMPSASTSRCIACVHWVIGMPT